LEEAEWEEVNNNSLMLALEGLDDRSKDILRSRWLSDEKATLHELADKYGISAERIRQLEKNAMNKIKAKMEA
jgi:RNA polymerase sigma-32 factor